MCYNFKLINQTCCNPFGKSNHHHRDIDVLSVTDFERELLPANLGNVTFLCNFCRLQLKLNIQDDQMEDYMLLIDVVSQVARMAHQQQRRNERQQRVVRNLQHQFRELMDSRAANNIPTVENKLVPNGIDMLLAAAEFVEKNGTNHECRNGQPVL